MSTPHRRRKPLKRYLDDYLRKPQQKYLDREFEIGQHLGTVRRHFRLAPYPLDRDTAEAIRGIIDNQVLPWGVIEACVEEWAFSTFFEEAVATEMTIYERSREDAVAAVPDLELLQCFLRGMVPESQVGPWEDRFADECETLRSIIKNRLFLDEQSLAGRFVHMPFLPLGENWLSRVPLLDQVWIDRRIVELCEASALLLDEEFTRLPAADPHCLAWHRFFPAETRWTSPTMMASHGVFVDALSRAMGKVRKMRTRACQISGRPFVHIDDYADWAGRPVRDDLRSAGMQEDGIPWARWNAWVDENAENGVVEVAGYRLSRLVDKRDIRDGETIRICPSSQHAEVALDERLRALDQLYSAAARLAPKLALGGLQMRILRCLDGRAMTADTLSEELPCDRTTLFRPRGIMELQEKGYVKNDQKVGGYYRPDCPPTLDQKIEH